MVDNTVDRNIFVNVIRIESCLVEQGLGQRVDQKTFGCCASELGTIRGEHNLFDADRQLGLALYHLDIIGLLCTRH